MKLDDKQNQQKSSWEWEYRIFIDENGEREDSFATKFHLTQFDERDRGAH